MAFTMDRPKKIAISVALCAVVGVICFCSLDVQTFVQVSSNRRLQTVVITDAEDPSGHDPDANATDSNATMLRDTANPCANNDVDEFAQDPTGEWCYIRMYRCSDRVNKPGLHNVNAGDLAWGAGGKSLGSMTCSHYGQYLQVWRVAVKLELMIKKRHYSQCNAGVCGCGLDGKCHGKKPAVNFGWRYKGGSKRQFSLPTGSSGDQWKKLCLERVVTAECVKKTTYNEKDIASVSTIFQRDVLDTPVSGCESQTKIKYCKAKIF
jgi:hypothetical protein